MATATETKLMTVEEFARRTDPGYPEELIRGRVEAITLPKPYHGYMCQQLSRLLGNLAEAGDLGYVLTNDSGVITQRGPDTVRGADVCYYSYAKVPKGSLPRDRYLDVPSDLVAEVLSPDDRWAKVLEKVAEYLNAGVGVVLVVDPEQRAVQAYEAERAVRIVGAGETLALPGVFGEAFAMEVGRLFE